MESLESKLDRLPPEKRKEIEDFVDFLLSQAVLPSVQTDADCNQSIQSIAPPPLTLPEPVHDMGTGALMQKDPVISEGRPDYRDKVPSATYHEIYGGIGDPVTHDYMDYGQYEHQSSPATEAVKKVRRKIIAREAQDRPHHLLDWVD